MCSRKAFGKRVRPRAFAEGLTFDRRQVQKQEVCKFVNEKRRGSCEIAFVFSRKGFPLW